MNYDIGVPLEGLFCQMNIVLLFCKGIKSLPQISIISIMIIIIITGGRSC